jgi:putative radical SAM enzyme (TIGR03279 family)
MMIINEIDPDGLAYALGLKPGDKLKSINGQPVRDEIDYQFNVYDEELTLEIIRDDEKLKFSIEKEEGEDLGVVFEEIQYRNCASDCVFCFVDQNPAGMRKALYFRDEDYRLSFLYGSYFTLNNVSKNDLKRIVSQRLSPLYISIHAIDKKTRAYLFGVNRNDRLTEKIEYLVENGIELHTQIVLCPGINDEDILIETIQELEKYYPGIRSVAVVPVGLTKYRDGLPEINPVTKNYARQFNPKIQEIQKEYLQKFGERFVYLSDEWYLTAERRLPAIGHYGELFQLENGVGMTRQFIESVKKQKNEIKRSLNGIRKLNLLTGKLAEPVLKEFIEPILKENRNLIVETTGIENSFYGSSITVSGLLTGSDFINAVSSSDADLFLLPPNILNPDGLTLDNMTIEEIGLKTGKRVMQYNGDINEIFCNLEAA